MTAKRAPSLGTNAQDPIPALRNAALFLLAAAGLCLADRPPPQPAKVVGWAMSYAQPGTSLP